MPHRDFQPPRLPSWLLDRVLPKGVRGATIKGDLLEEMFVRSTAGSPWRAKLWYSAQVLGIAAYAVLPRRGHQHDSSERRAATTMESLFADLKYAGRSLSRARGFTATALVTLALGIGASTAVFSIANAVLLRQLPYPDPDRLVWLSEARQSGTAMSIAWPNYLDWKDRSTTLDGLAALQRGTLNLTGTGEPERLDARYVTADFFQILGIHPVLGRTFTAAEDRAGAPPVVLISHDLWRRRFNADEHVLGRTIVLSDVAHEVIGVLPAGLRFNLITDDDVMASLGQQAAAGSGMEDRGDHRGVYAIGRLRHDADALAAGRELQHIAAALRQAHPNTNANVYAHIEPLHQRLVGPIATPIWVLFGAVAILLLLAIVNVANLLVARGVSRRHELAVRAALGGSRWRLVRQLLVESSLLTAVGGAAGVLTASVLIRLFIATAPADIPRLSDVGVSGAVLVFATALSAVTAFVLGVFPAIHSSAIRGQSVLVRAGRADTAPASAHRLRRSLMVVEVALAIVLLTGAGLMTRTMQALADVDTGFDATNLLTMRYSISGVQSTSPDEEAFSRRVALFGDMLLERVRALPDVDQAALALSLPIEGSQWGSVFVVSDQPAPPRDELPAAAFSPVSAGYFETLRLRLRQGRVFDARDAASAAKTAVVNEALARRFWPNGDAVGNRLKQGWPESENPWREIVGVVNDVKFEGIEASTPMQVYLPYTQEPSSYVALIVRSATSVESLAPAVRRTIHDLDPNLPLFAVQTMEDLLHGSVVQRSMTMVVFAGFASIALVMACVGLAGVVSQGVVERTREVGVRIALGASTAQVIGLFVGQGVIITTLGVAIGVAAGLALSNLARDLLFQVAPNDPVTFVIAAVTLTVIAAGACYIPARRAARVSPTIALRGE